MILFAESKYLFIFKGIYTQISIFNYMQTTKENKMKKIKNMWLLLLLCVLLFNCSNNYDKASQKEDSLKQNTDNQTAIYETIKLKYNQLRNKYKPQINNIKSLYKEETQNQNRSEVVKKYVTDVNTLLSTIDLEMEKNFGKDWKKYITDSQSKNEETRTMINSSYYGTTWWDIDWSPQYQTYFFGWDNNDNDIWALYVYGKKYSYNGDYNVLYAFVLYGDQWEWENDYWDNIYMNDLSAYSEAAVYSSLYGNRYYVSEIIPFLADDTNTNRNVPLNTKWQATSACERRFLNTYYGYITGNTINYGSIDNISFDGAVFEAKVFIDDIDNFWITNEEYLIEYADYPIAANPPVPGKRVVDINQKDFWVSLISNEATSSSGCLTSGSTITFPTRQLGNKRYALFSTRFITGYSELIMDGKKLCVIVNCAGELQFKLFSSKPEWWSQVYVNDKYQLYTEPNFWINTITSEIVSSTSCHTSGPVFTFETKKMGSSSYQLFSSRPKSGFSPLIINGMKLCMITNCYDELQFKLFSSKPEWWSQVYVNDKYQLYTEPNYWISTITNEITSSPGCHVGGSVVNFITKDFGSHKYPLFRIRPQSGYSPLTIDGKKLCIIVNCSNQLQFKLFSSKPDWWSQVYVNNKFQPAFQ